MSIQKTLSIIKPDAVRKNCIGEITKRFEDSGLKIIAARMDHLKKDQAGKFYEIHKDRPFFNDTATTEIYTSLFVGSVRCV